MSKLYTAKKPLFEPDVSPEEDVISWDSEVKELGIRYRGTEFVAWPHLQSETGTQAWFCDPSAPWQKGTVENTNRRARRWLPRKLNVRTLTDHELKMICERLNHTPRKCLGWKTPAEVFREKVLEETK